MTRLLFYCLIAMFCSCRKDPWITDAKYSYYINYVDSSYKDSSLTILTYNIQMGFTSTQDPWDKNQIGATPGQIHDIAEIIRRVNPGIILLQEVPLDRSNIEVKHFIEALADSLDMNFAFGNHGPNDPYGISPVNGMWGNATLSKYPVLEMENVEVLHLDEWKRRSVLRTRIRFNKVLDINVYNLHHSGTDKDEIKKTRSFIDRSEIPIIVGGDFNRVYGNEEIGLLNGLQDIFEYNITGIDRIYSSLNDTIYRIGTISRSNFVSDHWACYAKIRLQPD